jgi:hypothetical protein
MEKTCPSCGDKYLKAIYMGFPLRICQDEECACAQGCIALWLMEHMPVSQGEWNAGGWALYVYEGSYWKALWKWMFTKIDE